LSRVSQGLVVCAVVPQIPVILRSESTAGLQVIELVSCVLDFVCQRQITRGVFVDDVSDVLAQSLMAGVFVLNPEEGEKILHDTGHQRAFHGSTSVSGPQDQFATRLFPHFLGWGLPLPSLLHVSVPDHTALAVVTRWELTSTFPHLPEPRAVRASWRQAHAIPGAFQPGA